MPIERKGQFVRLCHDTGLTRSHSHDCCYSGMTPAFFRLQTLTAEIHQLDSVGNVLSWDGMIYLPAAAVAERARQIALVARLAHERQTSDEMGTLLADLSPLEISLPADSFEASLIRQSRRDHERSCRLPADFLERYNTHFSTAHFIWAKAREKNNFKLAIPALQKTVDLSREYAAYFPGHTHPADSLLDANDPAVTVALLRPLLAGLRQELLLLTAAIFARPQIDDSFLKVTYPESDQERFGNWLVEKMGFNFNCGRIDRSVHPFMARLGSDDIRITTRCNERDLMEGMSNTVHEGGHAIYEQGVSPELRNTTLSRGPSESLHESQSRLWEYLVLRDINVWRFAYPALQAFFPKQLRGVSLENFYRAINKVAPTFIRTEADEVTYNLHAIMRFDFELALLEGSLAVQDLPDAWRERMSSDLGITPQDDRSGCLQDPHWFDSSLLTFSGYVLGNILNTQLYEKALAAHPEIPAEFARGNFHPLRHWLTEAIYRHGAKFTMLEMIQQATGRAPETGPLLRYLRGKYGEIYSL